MNCHIHPAETLLLVPIHVVSERVSCLLPGLNKSLVKGMVGLPPRHMKRSAASPVPTAHTTNIRLMCLKDKCSSMYNLTEEIIINGYQ